MTFRIRTSCGTLLASLLWATVQAKDTPAVDSQLETAQQTIRRLQEKFAPDSHLAIYDVSVEKNGDGFVVTGEVASAEASQETERALIRAGIKATNEIVTLPAKDLEDKICGISCLSVANGREDPEQKAELGTQVLMGHTVQIWK